MSRRPGITETDQPLVPRTRIRQPNLDIDVGALCRIENDLQDRSWLQVIVHPSIGGGDGLRGLVHQVHDLAIFDIQVL